MTAKPRRPAQEDYDRALALYRANVSPESISERTGLSLEQIEHAMVEGWPATRGRHPKPALRAFEHVIEDRLHRVNLATLDWAQKVAEIAATHADDYARTVTACSEIKHMILAEWRDSMKASQERSGFAGESPGPISLAVPLDVVRSLRTLHTLMDPGQQTKIADVYRFLRGDEEADDGSGYLEQINATLDSLTEDQRNRWEEEGGKLPEPEQGVLQFPRERSG